MRNEEDVLKRITDTLKKQGKLQKGLVSYLGLTKGTYANWNRKQSYSFLCYLEDIAEYLGVSVEYWVTGRNKEIITNDMNIILSDLDRDILAKYIKLSETNKRYIRSEIRRLTEQ